MDNHLLQSEIDKALKNWLLKLNTFFIDPTIKQAERINSLTTLEKGHWTPAIKKAVHQRIVM